MEWLTGLASIAARAVGSAVQTTLGLGANIGARLLPIAMTTAYFGQQVMRWGTGNAQALARMGTITLQELQNAGITRQMAVSWQQFYSYVAQMNPANPSAAGRAELMQFVVDLFDKATMMNQDSQTRMETLRLTNELSRPVLLCLEPLGEQVTLESHGVYEIITSGGDAGAVEVILQDDKMIVYGWNGSDSVVLHNGKRIAGMEPSAQ